MVTLAIVSLLVLGALGVVGALARSRAVVARAEGPGPSEAVLRGLVASDLCHASQYRSTPGGLELELHTMLDPVTLQRRHLASTVTYKVAMVQNTSWLIRTQQVVGQADMIELVAPGVAGIAMEAAGTASAANPDGWFPLMPAGEVKVRRASADAGEIVIHFNTGEA
jgi:hypothetical protein